MARPGLPSLVYFRSVVVVTENFTLAIDDIRVVLQKLSFPSTKCPFGGDL